MPARTCVVLVNFKGAEDTGACVRSMLSCAELADLVVVDNTPDDPDLESAVSCYPKVHLMRAPENVGFGRGNNIGIQWAMENTGCEFIFILNNDASVEPDTIRKLEETLDLHPEAGMAVPRILLAEDHMKLWYGGGEVDWRRGSARVPGVLGAADADLAMTPRYVSFASGCAMMIRRSVLETERGFDPRFFMYEEDLELSMRIQEKGWLIWYEPAALVSHVGQGSQRGGKLAFVGSFNPANPRLPFFVYHRIKNGLLNMNMHARGKNRTIFFGFFPLFLLYKCAQWGLHGRTDALKSVLLALSDFRKENRIHP